jgi:hypothetical protein
MPNTTHFSSIAYGIALLLFTNTCMAGIEIIPADQQH